MARAEGDHFAENAYAFPRCCDCGDDILGASGHADFSLSPMRRQWSFKSLTGAAPTDTGDPAGRAICMGVVPIRVDIMGGEGETAAHPAIGVARGVTAATRRSTEGIRTGRGIRRRGKPRSTSPLTSS